MAAFKAPSANSLKEAEELALALSEVLSVGDEQEAGRLAQKLAALRVPVLVGVRQNAYPRDAIQMKVRLEDAVSSATISMSVKPGMKISDLKNEVNGKYGFHPRLQSWVIGKRLAQDRDTLASHGIKQDGDQAYLFILSSQTVQLTREQCKQDEENRRLEGIIETMGKNLLEPQGAEVGRKAQNGRAGQPVIAKPVVAPPLPKPQGWSCPQCTFVNEPPRPGCEICGTERPADYRVPDQYKQEELRRKQQDEHAFQQYQQALANAREENYQNLVLIDEHSLVPNEEEVDCPVCFTPVPPGEGAILRECLHTFCKDCLKGTITACLDAEVSCPYADNYYTCDRKLQDREIRSVLTNEEYQALLALRLSIAEARSDNSFHCKTADCQGWCIYEDEVNQFLCPLCQEPNCILCQAIHKDMNCKQYQDDLRIRAENDIAAKLTQEMLDAMLQVGDAMRCPKCKIIVQKKHGCDWICCLMCKTEICWATRQARWGPNGRGDTSGGCRCRVNGPCHPNCQNCH